MPIKLTDVLALPNGAQFYTADLHVHSCGGSHDVRDATMTPQALVDQAVKDGVALLSITDHNAISNVQAAIDHANQHHAGRILVLAGIEVTTAHGHLLVYFAPTEIDKLTRFYGRINIAEAGSPESHTTMSMADVATEAQRLGGICIAAHIDRKAGFECLQDGYPNWKKDIVTHPGILGVEVKDASSLVWYTPDDEQNDQGAGRKRLLQLRERAPGGFSRASFAHVQNSDAHSLQGFIDAHRNRELTRFKMDGLSFEGFRTALADPEARVRAVAKLPPAVPRILGMYVEGGFLNGESYRLSDNLTCFIGGRGTGKSTALKCLAHAFGVETDIGKYDNRPDSVVVYCCDAQEITYRYERMAGSSAPTVQAKENGKIIEVPSNSFRVEFYGQGHLADVAADPLSRADKFQAFLDRHLPLDDLVSREQECVAQLDQNGSTLRPLETDEATRADKVKRLAECDTKLKVAEEGKLKELVAYQASVAAEKTLVKSLDGIRTGYARGVSLRNWIKDYAAARSGAGTLTGDATTSQAFERTRGVIEETNQYLLDIETQINARLVASAHRIEGELKRVAAAHTGMDAGVAQKVAELQKAGLAASVAELTKVVQQRGQLAREIARLDERKGELDRVRAERVAMLASLHEARSERDRRRREHIREINRHLAKAIDDYTIVVVYEKTGLVDAFLTFVRARMQGTYLPEEVARKLCEATTPEALAEFVSKRDAAGLAGTTGMSADWAGRLIERLQQLGELHALELLDKPPAPIIRVMTKTSPTRTIPVNQLSDGQRHTILLTIAMLAESEVPLVIDQPEDDLDNAFVFSSVVRMLRDVKERRQVILVTHNANIAVLGDAELLFPMRRSGDRGIAFDHGSIDRQETKAAVQGILEGGDRAFLRRKEIYGY